MTASHATSGAISWSFLAPGCPRPVGGDIARFELVNALARAGRDKVRVVHLPTDEKHIRDLSDLPWFAFDPGVEHQFASDLDPDQLPDADVVVYSTKLLAIALAPSADPAGPRLVAELQNDRKRGWQPILLIQGHGVFPPAVEDLAFRLPGPKVCVGSWLADLMVQQGIPPSEVVHIPNGVDPQAFRVMRPIDARTPAVAMNFDPHPVKAGYAGIEALDQLYQRSSVPGTVFGTTAPWPGVPKGLRFVRPPSQAMIAAEIYNESSLFLQPSRHEGFGMCAVESMACGCALVTTANGGSADYAFDGETALVCGGEPAEMAAALGRLVADDALRTRLASNGMRFVERFRWSTSAERISTLALERLAEPDRSRAGDPIDVAEILHRLRQ